MSRANQRTRIAVYLAGWSAVAACAVVAAFSFADRAVHEVSDRTLVRFGMPGRPAEPTSDAEALLAERAAKIANVRVRLTTPAGKPAGEFNLRSLGARLDVEQTLTRIDRAARRSQNRLALWRAEDDEVRLVPPVVQLEWERLQEVANQLTEEVSVAPVSAKLDLAARGVVAEKIGAALDVYAFAEQVRAAAERAAVGDENLQLTLPTVEIPPQTTRADIEAIDISTVLGEFETHFSRAGEQSRRGENIDRAAGKLDGLVIPPGEVVSFNAVVGERSESNGFKKSWEIFKGEMVEGVGGGTCQVSSTFHAASFFGGLDVVERLPHSRPSAYIAMGLDSTVVYPTVDLKLKNPFPFPVVVHTKVTGNTLRVEVLGKTRPVSVHYSREVVKRLPFSRKLVEEPSLAANRVVHKQHGIDGYRIKRLREMTFADGTKKVEETTDYYPPTADIFEVPLGFDEHRLSGVAANAPAVDPSVAHSAEGALTAGDEELVILDGKGAHSPTRRQARPEAHLRMGR